MVLTAASRPRPVDEGSRASVRVMGCEDPMTLHKICLNGSDVVYGVRRREVRPRGMDGIADARNRHQEIVAAWTSREEPQGGDPPSLLIPRQARRTQGAASSICSRRRCHSNVRGQGRHTARTGKRRSYSSPAYRSVRLPLHSTTSAPVAPGACSSDSAFRYVQVGTTSSLCTSSPMTIDHLRAGGCERC